MQLFNRKQSRVPDCDAFEHVCFNLVCDQMEPNND
jgi:hypothetical protein